MKHGLMSIFEYIRTVEVCLLYTAKIKYMIICINELELSFLTHIIN